MQLTGGNLREDVLNAMDRLHVLWSLDNSDYGREYPTVSALPLSSIVDTQRTPRTVAAIVRNREPTIHHLVAQNLLHRPLSQPVGRNMPNLRDDVLMLQISLRALRLLSEPDFARERAAAAAVTTVTTAETMIPKTLTALTELKEAFASSRLGWAPLQADESEAGGDRFGGRTFDFEVTTLCSEPRQRGSPRPLQHLVSIFIPRGATPRVNKVHVFFSPREAAGNRGDNDVLVQGLRGASDATDWILIGVSGITNGWRTINSTTISECLVRAGRPAGIEAVRLSGHSRGVGSLRETVIRRLINVRIDRVVVLDAPELLPNGAPGAARTIVYRVNVQGKSVPGAVHRDLDPGCMRAIGYTKLIRNAIVTHPYLTIPSTISRQLLPIPDRGYLTTTPASALRGSQVNLGAFCHTNRAAISGILRQESGPDGLHAFVETHDLLRAAHGVSPSIYSHHVFVAEIAHEITGL
jgi:hypothetical protein